MYAVNLTHNRFKNLLLIRVNELMAFFMLSLITLKLIFSFSYHLQKLELVSYLIDGLLILISFLVLLRNKSTINKIYIPILLFPTIFIFYVAVQAIFYGNVLEAVSYYNRFFIPIIIYFCLIKSFRGDFEKFEKKTTTLAFLIFSLGFIGLFFMPENYNHHEMKMPTYFSGLHKSSYIFISATLLMFALYPSMGKLQRFLSIPVLAFACFMLLEGWGIRTPLLMIVVFISVYFTFNNFSQIKLLFGFILPVLIFILIVVFGENIDWNRMSSGRLTMWDAKINLLVDSTLNQVVFGKGLGSDYIKVEGWAGEKDSHNNYLQTITELGIIGLTLLIASIVSLYKLQPNVFGRGVVVAYAISGAVSNGVIYRLVPGYIFALLLAYIALKYTHSKSKIC